MVLGTLPYMAPEALEGGPIDARSDLFALGAIIYEMVTGRRAFSADSDARLIADILGTDPPSLLLAQPAAPETLARIVRGCLAKKPADRYQTAREVVLYLSSVHDSRSLSLPPAGTRRYFGFGAAAAVVVALSPDSWRGYSNLGGVYYAQGRTDDAIAAFTRSLSVRPNYQAASNLGTLYFYVQGDYRRAADAFEQALKNDPSEYVVWGNFAAALHWAKDEPRARDAFAKAAELAEAARQTNPRDPDVLMSLASYYAALDERERPIQLAAQALAIAPDNAALLYEAGVLYEYRLGDRDKALEFLGRALERGHPLAEIDKAPSLAGLRTDKRVGQLRHRGSEPANSNERWNRGLHREDRRRRMSESASANGHEA